MTVGVVNDSRGAVTKARTLVSSHDDGLRRQGELSEAAGCKGHYFKRSPIWSE
jgi:hypothetical protein